MNPHRLRLARRGLVLPVVLAVFGCCSAFAAADDDRITGLNEQIRTLETVVAKTTDTSSKARLDEKLQRLRQELMILQDRAQLEARERQLQTSQTATTLDVLREKLRNIEFVAEDTNARLTGLDAQRRQVIHDRDTLASELATLRGEKNASADNIVAIEEHLATKSEELRAISLEKDAVESTVDLAHDADLLRERLKAADTSVGRPTLRLLFESYTRARTEIQSSGRLTADATDLAQKLKISEDSLALSKQKLEKFDEELALLEKQTSFFRRDDRVERLLTQQRSQKAGLEERLPLLSRQVEAIKGEQQAITIRQELATLKATFERETFERLKASYLHRLRWPVVALTALLIIYLIATFALLPIAFRNESLFLARRFARYLAVLIATGVIAGFLFDDLSMIAATLGIVSAALVISLQDVCTSVAGWLVIMVGGKFKIGDRLEIDGTRGDVLDVQLLRTTLLEINAWLGIDQPTGRVIVLPNNMIFKTKVFNFNHGHPFIWGKIDITVTYSTPVASALTLFQRVLEEETREEFAAARQASHAMQRRYGVEDAVYEPKTYTQIADSGVTISLFYVAHYRQASATRNRINRRLIAEIESHPHIQLAYNTLTVFRSDVKHETPSAMLGADLTTPPFRKVGAVPRAT